MRRILLLTVLVLSTFAVPCALRAQDTAKPAEAAPPAHAKPNFYHLEFFVQELDSAGRLTNGRRYTTSVSTESKFFGSLRTGSKIPIETGSYQDKTSASAANIQYQYVDVGVSFDMSQVEEAGRELSMSLSAELSSVAGSADPNLHQPVIRQNKWRATVLVPIGKSTVIFRSDSLDSTGSIQVTLTATPIS